MVNAIRKFKIALLTLSLLTVTATTAYNETIKFGVEQFWHTVEKAQPAQNPKNNSTAFGKLRVHLDCLPEPSFELDMELHNIAPDTRAWGFATSNYSRWYPSSEPLEVENSHLLARIGTGFADYFDVHLILIPNTSVPILNAYLSARNDDHEWAQGLEALPPGSLSLDRVSRLPGSCRLRIPGPNPADGR